MTMARTLLSKTCMTTMQILKRNRVLARAQRKLARRGKMHTLFQVCAIIGNAINGKAAE